MSKKRGGAHLGSSSFLNAWVHHHLLMYIVFVMQHGKLRRVRQKIESELSMYHESRDSYLSNGTKTILIFQLVPV